MPEQKAPPVRGNRAGGQELRDGLFVAGTLKVGAGVQASVYPGAVAFFKPVFQIVAAAGDQVHRPVRIFAVDGFVFLVVMEIQAVLIGRVILAYGRKKRFQVRAGKGRITRREELVGVMVFQDGRFVGCISDLVAFVRTGGVGDLVAPKEPAGVVAPIALHPDDVVQVFRIFGDNLGDVPGGVIPMD